MANNSGSSVPKFSSFKPKPKRQVNAESSDARSDTRNDRRGDGDRQEVRLGRHRVEKSRSNRDWPRSPPRSPRDVDRYRNIADDRATRRRGSYSHEARNDRHPHRTSKRNDGNPRNQPHQQHPEDRPSDLFTIDVKGDLANSQYRQSNKWNVPLYHLFGSGSLLGHDPEVKIDRQLSNEHGFTLRYPPKKLPLRRAGVTEIDEMFKPPPKVAMEGGEDDESREDDFLPLPERKRDEGESFHSRWLDTNEY